MRNVLGVECLHGGSSDRCGEDQGKAEVKRCECRVGCLGPDMKTVSI